MKRFALITFITIFSLYTYSQQMYVVSGESKIIIEGTSNLHDWEENVGKIKGLAEIATVNGSINKIVSLSLEIDTKSIKSGKSIMDNKTYEALKANDYPLLTFKYERETSIEAKAGEQLIACEGVLSIAGVSKNISLSVTSKTLSNGNIQITGEKSLVMEDYNVSPPTALFGALKTGSMVKVKFTLIIK